MGKNSGYIHIKKTIEVFVCGAVVTARGMVFVHDVAGAYPEHGEILQCVTKEKYLVWRRKREVLFYLARTGTLPCSAAVEFSEEWGSGTTAQSESAIPETHPDMQSRIHIEQGCSPISVMWHINWKTFFYASQGQLTT